MKNTLHSKTVLLIKGIDFWNKHKDIFNDSITFIHERIPDSKPSIRDDEWDILELAVCNAIEDLTDKGEQLDIYVIYVHVQRTLGKLLHNLP